MTVNLTTEQKIVVDACVEKLRRRTPLTTLGGYAGTGKTTVIREIASRLKSVTGGKPIAFACYTGKARSVLSSKLGKSAEGSDFIGTLHQFLMRPEVTYQKTKDGGTERIIKFMDRDDISDDFSALIVDEASMVGGWIMDKIRRTGLPVLAVGDHGQLPPVYSDAVNLMEDPDFRLNNILRQAEGDPIIRASMEAREFGTVPSFIPRASSISDARVESAILSDFWGWQAICATNKMRCWMNAHARRTRGFKLEQPMFGEKVVCLANNHAKGIANGMIGFVSQAIPDGNWYKVLVSMDYGGGGIEYDGKVFRHQFGKPKTLSATTAEAPDVHPEDFGDLFDWGYCMTVHKSQGSEWKSVVFLNERSARGWIGQNWPRFLYTAVTRARENLLVVDL